MAGLLEKTSVQTRVVASVFNNQDHFFESSGTAFTFTTSNYTAVSSSPNEDGPKSKDIIIGVSVGGALCLLLLILICCLLKRRRKRKSDGENRTESRIRLQGDSVHDSFRGDGWDRCCCCCLRCCCRPGHQNGWKGIYVKFSKGSDNSGRDKGIEVRNRGRKSATVSNDPGPNPKQGQQLNPGSQCTEFQETSLQVVVPSQASADDSNPLGDYVALAQIGSIGPQPGSGGGGDGGVGAQESELQPSTDSLSSVPSPRAPPNFINPQHPVSNISNPESRPDSQSPPSGPGVPHAFGNPLNLGFSMSVTVGVHSPELVRNPFSPPNTSGDPFWRDQGSRGVSEARSEGDLHGQDYIGSLETHPDPSDWLISVSGSGAPTTQIPFDNLMPFISHYTRYGRNNWEASLQHSQSPQHSFLGHSQNPSRSSKERPSSLSDPELQAAGYVVGRTKARHKPEKEEPTHAMSFSPNRRTYQPQEPDYGRSRRTLQYVEMTQSPRKPKKEESTHAMWCPQEQELDDARSRPMFHAVQSAVPSAQRATLAPFSLTLMDIPADVLYIEPPTPPDHLDLLTPTDDELDCSDREDSEEEQGACALRPSRKVSRRQTLPRLLTLVERSQEHLLELQDHRIPPVPPREPFRKLPDLSPPLLPPREPLRASPLALATIQQ